MTNTININDTRRAVIKKAKALYFGGVSESWSTCMKMAWAAVKFIQAVKAGKPVKFLKGNGTIREVRSPRIYSPKGGAAAKSKGRKSPVHLVVFEDPDRNGHTVISADIRLMIAG